MLSCFYGGDRSMVKIGTDKKDEISDFENMRCIGPLEACSRIFSIPQSERFPAVQQLTVHLPREQSVIFEEGGEREAATNKELRKTQLTEFFEFNRLNPDVRLKYCDFPEQFKWMSLEKRWRRRKTKNGTIGRVYTVHPSSGERFYLRMLLHHDFCKGKFHAKFF